MEEELEFEAEDVGCVSPSREGIGGPGGLLSQSPCEERDARVARVQPLGRGVRQALREDHGLQVTRAVGATVNYFDGTSCL